MPITPLKKVMCSKGERKYYDLTEWWSHKTNNAEELRKRLDEMHLVGRTISDFRFLSFCYNMTIEGIEEIVYSGLLGYPTKLREKLSSFDRIDDYYPIPLTFSMDSPVLIKFEDGDSFEIDTEWEGEYNISMNEIPWDAENSANPENIDGSSIMDLCRGVKISKAEVMESTDSEGRAFIEGVIISFWYDRYLVSMHFESWASDYMFVWLDFDRNTLKVPFIKVKQSMYREYYEEDEQ